jgi:hypothetical protein
MFSLKDNTIVYILSKRQLFTCTYFIWGTGMKNKFIYWVKETV